MPRHALAALALFVLVASAGCAVNGGSGDAADPPRTSRDDKTTSEGDPEALAIADLATHTGVDPADIDVVVHEQVTWRDGSLGCPKPGEFYTMMLVEGYRMVLRAGAEEYSYHGAAGKPPVRCAQPDPNGAVDSSTGQ